MQPDGNQRGYLYERFRLFHTVDQQTLDVSWHYHAFDKLVFFIGGHAEYTVESETVPLMPGDIILVAYGQLHKMHADEDIPYERYILYLDSGYLSAQAAEAGGLNACFARARRDGHCLLRLSDADRAAVFQLFVRLEKALKDESPYGPALSEALLTELMIFICRAPEEKGDPTLAAADTDEKIQQALHYIQSHLGANLSCDALASRLYMSRSSFQHRFKAATGYAPHAYIRLKRLLYASELLADGEPALTAGRKCGYTDHSAFCHAFTAQFGMTPSAYRPRNSLIGPDE